MKGMTNPLKEDKIGMAIHKNKLGNILDDQNKTSEALKEYQIGLKFAEEANYPLLQTDLLDNVGRLFMQTKRYVEAEKYLKRNESLSESLESPEAQKSAYHSLGELYNVQGKFNLANAYFKKGWVKRASHGKAKWNTCMTDEHDLMIQECFLEGEKDKKWTKKGQFFSEWKKFKPLLLQKLKEN